MPLITKIILQDDAGNLYSIEPNETGLQFAKGELTFKEYEQQSKKANRHMLGILIASTVIFIGISYAVLTFII